MPPIRLCGFLLAASSVFAGSNSAVISLPVEMPRGTPAVSLIQTADYLCAVVLVRGTAKDPDRQMIAVQDALQRLNAAVQRSNAFQLHQGPVRFSGGAGGSSALFSKSSYGPGALQTSLRVLCPLSANADIFDAIRQMNLFITHIEVPSDSEVKILSTTLAVTAAEQQRDRLMQLIREQITATRQQLGANVITVSGLDSPVLVRQLDNVNVELFIDYQLSATLEK
jgi:hypothetical protein